MKLSSQHGLVLFFCAAALLVATAYLFLAEVELDRPWKAYQRQFRSLDLKLTAAEREKTLALPDGEEKRKKLQALDKRLEKIDSTSPTIKQLWLTDLGVTDRCMTCHQGVELPRFQDAPQPLTTHPGRHIDPKRHAVDTYGCVVCHAGQGVALEAHEAHGQTENWVEPFLPGNRAEASCNGCHPMGTNLPMAAVMEDAPVYSKGRALYLTSNCLGCHVLNGHERPKKIGPTLTELSSKTNAGWFQSWVKKPKSYLPQTVMPDFELAEGDVNAMAAYLFSLNKPLPANAGIRNAMAGRDTAKTGRAKLEDLGCLGCHTVDGKDTGFAPDLSRLGEKATPEWLANWIKNPKKYWPETAMPNLRVPDEDVQLLAAYLAGLKGAKPIAAAAASDSKQLIERGRLLVRDKGCTGCHKVADFSLGFNAPAHNNIGVKRVDELVFADAKIPRTLSDWLKLKVKDPRAFNSEKMPTLMPKFGFSDDEAEALLTFLLGQRPATAPADYRKILHDPASPLVRGELLLERHNCRGCHRIGDAGGNIGPELSAEGAKVTPQWLTAFLQKPHKIRPVGIEPTRMPTFGFTPEEANDIAAYFAARERKSPITVPVAKKQLSPEERDKTWKEYFQVFSCQACHSWNGQGGIIGPDQSDSGNRLQAEWIARWLKNPQAMIPDVRMPNFELYDDEINRLATLLTGFSDISPAIWEQMRRRWEDELLARQGRQMGGH